MKLKHYGVLIGIGLSAFFFHCPAFADNTRVTNPSALYLELGGRGLLYTVGFDRVLNENLAAGVGIGSVEANQPDGTNSGTSATVIPVYVNYYFTTDAGSLFGTVGADLVTNSNAVADLSASPSGMKFSSNPIIATVGIGYEYRSDPGYFFRVAGYGLVGGSVVPWGGVTFGYSF